MTPPPTILFSSIDLGERGRTVYTRIEELAESISDNGLIQPIVLVPTTKTDLSIGEQGLNMRPVFGLDAGGRRYHALKLLFERGDWDGVLHHAATSEPGRPGYVLKGETFTTPVQRLMTEIAENLNRDEMDWRDQVKLIVKAYRMNKKDAHIRGEQILMADFGAMLGVGFQDLRAAEAIHDDLILHPEAYKDCTSIRGAFTKVFKETAIEATKLLAAKELIDGPKLVRLSPSVSIQSEPEPMQENKPIVIPLSTAFLNCDSLEFMRGLKEPTFDHIVTDPDYGVSVERLNANMEHAQAGVVQTSIYESVNQTCAFIDLAWKTIREQGFLVFWYDLDHHEKLQAYATLVGFRVQRWPLIWHKPDYFSNADTAHNFTKNFEYAMVCRKPNAVLSQVQKTSIFTCATGSTTRDFNHPFAKPLDVWKWIYSAISIKGQTVYDPFLGSGTSAVAATNWGLRAVGSEIDSGHYANSIMNLQGAFKKMLGGNITFS